MDATQGRMATSRVGWTLAIALWALEGNTGCGRSPTAPAPPLPDLSGHWEGLIDITMWPLPTPMAVDLTDNGGTLTGSGGGADCRFFPMCGSFSAYTVSGTHDAVRVALNGATQGGRTWTLTGTLSDGASQMSGTGSGSEFGPSRWELQKRP